MDSKARRYTFAQVARREGADCTTTITTTVVHRYVDAEDYDADEERAREAEARCARLRRYVRHDRGCNHYNVSEYDSSDCTCGLDAALAPGAEAGKGGA